MGYQRNLSGACCGACARGGMGADDPAAIELQRQLAAKQAADAKVAARPEFTILRAVFIGGLALWGWKQLQKAGRR
jgi:hypothetical protein